jgi:membrane protease YdiL (CAAX protease family)
MWQYVIFSYLLFWVLILGLGGVASMVFHAPPVIMNGITILCSWSPTIVLLLMLKKLKPGLTIVGFYKQVFRERLNIPFLFIIPVIVFGIFLATIWLLSVLEKTSFLAQLAIPSALGGVILLTTLQGPSGEESGWRGYLRPELEERYGFIKGNLILGLVWAFWHTPLWFIASDYSGSQAFMYIVANIIVMTSLTFIMGIFMRRCNNLLIAFWIHLCFNFSLRFFAGDVYFFAIISVLYIVVTLALLRFFHRSESAASLKESAKAPAKYSTIHQ